MKFADADLIGFPIRVNIGDRGLNEGKVEMKLRNTAEVTMVLLDRVADEIRGQLENQ